MKHAILVTLATLALASSLPRPGVAANLPPSQWRLRFLAISCRSAPCSDRIVEDRKTGEWFPALVSFANPADKRRAQTVQIGAVDFLADGDRTELTMSARRYTSMVISRVVGQTPATAGAN